MVDPVAGLLLNYLQKVVYEPESAVLNPATLPDGFKEFGEGLICFAEYVKQTRALAEALSKGTLDIPLPPSENEMAAPLKSLHAALRHLTWQTEQVAKGDYSQRVDFMGDFSKAFNSMTKQLALQRASMLEEISGRQEKIHLLEQNKSIYELLAGQVEQWVVVIDANTSEWLFVSQDADRVLADPLCKKQLGRWMKEQADSMGGKEKITDMEIEFADAMGQTRYYSVSIYPHVWDGKDAYAFLLLNISGQKERLNSLQNIANYDTLTQVFNRRYGMEIMSDWLDQRRSFVVCFADIDNLKLVNDRCGHYEGDKYIICVSQILREFSPDAIVCRVGGDEFMLLAAGWSSASAMKRMEELRNKLSNYDGPAQPYYEYSVSYGVIEVGEDNTLLMSDLLSAADEKMYECKRAYKLRRKSVQRESGIVPHFPVVSNRPGYYSKTSGRPEMAEKTTTE